MKDWSERKFGIAKCQMLHHEAPMGYLFSIREAQVFAFQPASRSRNSQDDTGFDFFPQDRGGIGHDKLMAA